MAAGTVRDALLRAGYTSDGVLELLGGDAFAALGRGERVPARHALAGAQDSALADLVRLFLLGETVPAARAATALPLSAAVQLGVIGTTAEDARGRVQVQPYPVPDGTIYLASDFPADPSSADVKPLSPDHVIGVGGASVTLATITPRRRVERVLDLGTGCGIQAVLAAGHGGRVVATDTSRRAVRMAALSAGLSGVELQLRTGSLFEPVAGEQFDLIVANPPFVISPVARYTYREAPPGGDDLSRTVVRQSARHLAPGGIAVILANWLHVAGQPWQERLAGWAPDGCRVWAVQREYLPPAQYAEVWLRDSAEFRSGYAARYEQWLAHLRDLRAEGVGFGWIVVQRAEPAWFTAEDLVDADGLPDGDQVLAALAALSAQQRADALTVLGAHPRFTPDAIVQRTWRPVEGEDGAELMVGGDWRPFEPVDPAVVDLLGRTGSLAARIAAVAGGDDDMADDLTARALVAIRSLIGAGLITIEP